MERRTRRVGISSSFSKGDWRGRLKVGRGVSFLRQSRNQRSGARGKKGGESKEEKKERELSHFAGRP